MLKRNSINGHCKFGVRQKWELASRIGDFGNVLNGFAKSPQLIVLNIDWMQFVLKNCEILHSVRSLYDKQYCFTSDVMYKKYKRLAYTPPDFLARFWKLNLSKAKNSAWPPDLLSKNLYSRPNLLWSRAIMTLKCERRWLLFFGVYRYGY